MINTHLKMMTRRSLLKNTTAVGGLAVVGGGFIAAPTASWALEVNMISEHEMATLLQMARDIYPHDRIGDEYYAIAVKGYDSEDNKQMVADGVALLDKKAAEFGYESYLKVDWEANRTKVLQAIEGEAFFQTIRGGLVTGLYNQKAVWPIFGYEGESFTKGGYLNRGFDDINWL